MGTLVNLVELPSEFDAGDATALETGIKTSRFPLSTEGSGSEKRNFPELL